MFSVSTVLEKFRPAIEPADFLPFEPEFASQYDPADCIGDTVWCKLYDTSSEEVLCWVEDHKTVRGVQYALFVPVNGRCERWRMWECAVELG